MTFRRIDNYATSDPDTLGDQLSQLEDNIAAAISALPERLTFRDWVSSGTVQAFYGTVTRCDTLVNPISVVLPSVSPGTAGRPVGVKLKGTNNVTVYPVESTATIDGAADDTLVAEGLTLYVHDGTEWSVM